MRGVRGWWDGMHWDGCLCGCLRVGREVWYGMVWYGMYGCMVVCLVVCMGMAVVWRVA